MQAEFNSNVTRSVEYTSGSDVYFCLPWQVYSLPCNLLRQYSLVCKCCVPFKLQLASLDLLTTTGIPSLCCNQSGIVQAVKSAGLRARRFHCLSLHIHARVFIF